MFCCYFDSNFDHVTSEYIGNFNYGYTGSYLFDLNTLHLGSSAVSGFDPADVSDWPAIDAGFENAPNTYHKSAPFQSKSGAAPAAPL